MDELDYLDLTNKNTRIYLPDGDVPLSAFCGSAGIFDVANDVCIEYNRACESFDEGDIMLLYTNEKAKAFLTDGMLNFILARKIKMVVTDAPGVDYLEEARVRDRLAKAGIPLVVNAGNLSRVVAASPHQAHGEGFLYEFFAFPMLEEKNPAHCLAVIRVL